MMEVTGIFRFSAQMPHQRDHDPYMTNSLRTDRLHVSIVLLGVMLSGCGETTADTPLESLTPANSETQEVSSSNAENESSVIEDGGQAQQSADSESQSQWGHFTGRFVFDGSPPERQKLELSKDIEYCSKHQPTDESLIVNSENGGLANVVIWLDVKTADEISKIHPSYTESSRDQVSIINEGCRFSPRVCIVHTNQTLVIENKDSVDHNTAAFLNRNTPFNAVTPRQDSIEKQLKIPERKPAKINCSIHSWMIGWLVVKDHPYVAVSDENGNFEIRNLPPGEWTFRAWHEIPEYIEEVTRNNEILEWSKGRFSVTVTPSNNDLGEIRVKPALFQR